MIKIRNSEFEIWNEMSLPLKGKVLRNEADEVEKKSL